MNAHTRLPDDAWASERRPMCKIDGCYNPRYGRGWCQKHYSRWRRHGDPEKTIAPTAGDRTAFLNKAISYAGGDCLFWPYARNPAGYGRICVGPKVRTASRVICEMAHGQPPSGKHHAAHSCGNGHLGCVNPKHLRWASPKENCADKITHGTLPVGCAHPGAKLSEGDVLLIRSLSATHSQRALAARFGVSRRNIRAIIDRDSWGWLK